METFIKRFFPKSLWGRCFLILSAPLLLVQIGLVYVFFQRHTETILRLTAQNIAGDAAVVSQIYEMDPIFAKKIAEKHLRFRFQNSGLLGEKSWLLSFLDQAFKDHFQNHYRLMVYKDDLVITLYTKKGTLCLATPTKRLLSRTTPLVLVFTFFLSFFSLIIAALFMKRQVYPIRELSKAAHAFGCGNFHYFLKASGATEVRQAILAFHEMRERIQCHLSERFEMLACLSHDLRTPLTRLKLRLACMPKTEDLRSLSHDVDQMHQMIETFLMYARSQAQEDIQFIHVYQFLSEFEKDFPLITINCSASLSFYGRPILLRRCFSNILSNAARFAKNTIYILVTQNSKSIVFTIDDDGPGIPEDEYESVFRPFYRLDTSRNLDQIGVGLGLSMVRDTVRIHGGSVTLNKSPLSGLRVVIEIPYETTKI